MAGMASLSLYAQDSKEKKHYSCSDSSQFSLPGVTVRKIGKDSMIVYVRMKEMPKWKDFPSPYFQQERKI